MNQDELTAYNKQWLEGCLKSEEIFEHEKVLLKVMIGALPCIMVRDITEENRRCTEEISDLYRKALMSKVFHENKFIVTSKKKKLTGKDLELFLKFWKAFDYKKSRAEAAQAWLDIPDTKDEAFMEHIIYAAQQYRIECKNPGAPKPKMAQGWLNTRRWEDYEASKAVEPENWTLDEWRKMMTRWVKTNQAWPPYYPGPNPWETLNTDIPPEIRAEYAEKWGWKGL